MPQAHIIGLLVFIAVTALNVGGLLLDVLLYFLGKTQITYIVWDHPSAGIPIIALQILGAVGLAVHFYLK